MLGRCQTIRRFSQPGALPPHSSTSDAWGLALRTDDSTHPYLAPMQPWPRGTPQGWCFPTAQGARENLGRDCAKTPRNLHGFACVLLVPAIPSCSSNTHRYPSILGGAFPCLLSNFLWSRHPHRDIYPCSSECF